MAGRTAKTYEIICENCSHPYTTIRKNTKRCRVCQVGRDLQHFVHRGKQPERVCIACDASFYALDSARAPFCGECDMVESSLNLRGHCGACGRDNRILLHEDIRICKGCATSKKWRKGLTAQVTRKMVDRVNNPPVVA